MQRNDIQVTARKIEFIRERSGGKVEITFDAHRLSGVSILKLAKPLSPSTKYSEVIDTDAIEVLMNGWARRHIAEIVTTTMFRCAFSLVTEED